MPPREVGARPHDENQREGHEGRNMNRDEPDLTGCLLGPSRGETSKLQPDKQGTEINFEV